MELREYARHDAVGLREALAAAATTAAEVEAAARQALEIADAEVNGLALPVFSPALDHAHDGPLAGVPFLIKDSGPMAAGVPFFLGSRSLRGALARRDCDLMTRFRAAGLVTLGLTTVPELGLSFSTESVKHGPARNPWCLERGAGGVERRRWSQPGRCRSRTAMTAPARSGSRRPAAGWWGSSRAGAGPRAARTRARPLSGLPTSSR
jgi:amidase